MNLVVLMGRLTKDPELRYTSNNTPVCKFTIAVKKPGKVQQGHPDSDFFVITAWKQTAEFVARYFTKGQQILVTGSLRNNNYEDSRGTKHFSNDVHASAVEFADSKRNTESQVPQTYAEEQPDKLYNLGEDDEDLPF